jgi:hypothetical protein
LELPDSPALQSVLYTHRNVIGSGPTCEEQLARVEANVTAFVSTLRHRIDTDASLAHEAEERAAADAAETESRRQMELDAVLSRMTEAFESIDKLQQDRVDRIDESVRRMRNRDTERRQAEQDNVHAYCASLDRFEDERRRRLLQIEHADQRGKVEVEETLRRGLNLTAEERSRVQFARVVADDREALRLFEESVRERRKLIVDELIASKEWVLWAEHLAQRCNHQTTLMRLKQQQYDGLGAVERGDRGVVALAELRAREALFVDAIEVGVSSPSRRRQAAAAAVSVVAAAPATNDNDAIPPLPASAEDDTAVQQEEAQEAAPSEAPEAATPEREQ